MAFRQAVIQVGSWTIKAGLWEQTSASCIFAMWCSLVLIWQELPACVRRVQDKTGAVTERQYGEHDDENGVYPIVEGRLVDPEELEHLLCPFMAIMAYILF